MAIFKVLCLFGFVVLSLVYGRTHEEKHGSHHHNRAFHRYKHIIKRHLNVHHISRHGPTSKRSEKVEESSHKVWQQKQNDEPPFGLLGSSKRARQGGSLLPQDGGDGSITSTQVEPTTSDTSGGSTGRNSDDSGTGNPAAGTTDTGNKIIIPHLLYCSHFSFFILLFVS